MDLAFHDSRFTAEISKRMQVIIYEILKYSRMNNLMKIKLPALYHIKFTAYNLIARFLNESI